jgi:hypothetical protein
MYTILDHYIYHAKRRGGEFEEFWRKLKKYIGYCITTSELMHALKQFLEVHVCVHKQRNAQLSEIQNGCVRYNFLLLN